MNYKEGLVRWLLLSYPPWYRRKMLLWLLMWMLASGSKGLNFNEFSKANVFFGNNEIVLQMI